MLRVYAARKKSWNPAGVEPVHWKLAHIDLAHVLVVQIRNELEFGVNGTNPRKGHKGVEIPHPRSFLGGHYKV